MKICSKCGGNPKPLDDFYPHPGAKDKRRNICKVCHKKTGKQYRETDNGKAVIRKRKQSPKYKSKAREYDRAWLKRNPEKQKAKDLVRTAINSGQLVKPASCSVCDITDRLYAHHEDYTKPLEVIWFCASHHALRHQELLAIVG